MNTTRLHGGGHATVKTASANVATLMKAGNFRKISGPSKHSNHTVRNRRILVFFAVLVLFLGGLSIIL